MKGKINDKYNFVSGFEFCSYGLYGIRGGFS
jgi:hypothetical protein